MGRITVLRPDAPMPPSAPIELARRRRSIDGGTLTLIENGKPHARELLELIGAELKRRLGLADVTVFSKGSASQTVADDVARMLAARSRLIITGVGD